MTFHYVRVITLVVAVLLSSTSPYAQQTFAEGRAVAEQRLTSGSVTPTVLVSTRMIPKRLRIGVPLRWLRLAADNGLAEAQFNLGGMYTNGDGVIQDDAEAVRWYRRAATQGYAAAQNGLGLMYSTGRGVPQNYVEAHKWFNIAAAQASDERDLFVSNRTLAAERMTAKQIAEAQRRAREWRPTAEQ